MKNKIMLLLITLMTVSIPVFAEGEEIPPSPELTTIDLNLVRSNRFFAESLPNPSATVTLSSNKLVVRTTTSGSFIYGMQSGWTYDNPATPSVETRDLSSLGSIVVGINGAIYSNQGPFLGMALEDVHGNSSYVRLVDVSSAEQYWSVPTSYFTNDLSNIVRVRFGTSGYNITGTNYSIRAVPPVLRGTAQPSPLPAPTPEP